MLFLNKTNILYKLALVITLTALVGVSLSYAQFAAQVTKMRGTMLGEVYIAELSITSEGVTIATENVTADYGNETAQK